MITEIFEEVILIFKGKIIVEDLIKQIGGFVGYSIEEIFAVFSEINNVKLNIIKDKDEYKLDISIKILKKEKQKHFVTIITKFKLSKDNFLKRLKKKSKKIIIELSL